MLTYFISVIVVYRHTVCPTVFAGVAESPAAEPAQVVPNELFNNAMAAVDEYGQVVVLPDLGGANRFNRSVGNNGWVSSDSTYPIESRE